ncbi:hypothetical protein CARUB_v10007948mg [Capsella rubella]|uniref:Uncharacterized protein n=1 Tax=Capsella rubella TaxID=81985 RepID=R0ETB0_9BRAS|nr:hypothetical protein CARUB_v10007948mg [Capsella rubella]
MQGKTMMSIDTVQWRVFVCLFIMSISLLPPQHFSETTKSFTPSVYLIPGKNKTHREIKAQLRMALVVRLAQGEWRRNEQGEYEHVADLQGYCLAVRIRERDDLKTVTASVKARLQLREEDKVELTYQWPKWMMGPEWNRADPIDIQSDEDMTLFMAIRADVEELYLRVKVVRSTSSGNDSTMSRPQAPYNPTGRTSAEISDIY